MALTETPNRGAGRGASRFLVRGPSLITAEQHLLLRPRYNEYPERSPQIPGYPQPGNRGPSRPRATGGAEDQPPTPPPGLFPTPRPRDPSLVIPTEPGQPPPPGFAPAGSCIPRGNSFSQWEALADGASTYFLSPTIQGPFVVTHYKIMHDAGAGGSAAIKLLIGRGPSASGTSDDVGFPIFGNAGGWAAEQDPRVSPQEGYPNIHIPAGPHHIKARFRNNSGGAAEFQYIVDVIYLDQ